MANNSSTKKRIRQNEKRRVRNSQEKSAMRTISKRIIKMLEAKGDKNVEEIISQLNKFNKAIDKGAQNRTIHWKKAARLKSRMALKVNKVSAS